MSKEVFIALIQKDLRELDLLAQGLYENELPSPTFVKLASAKAQEVIDNLQKLSELRIEEPQEKIIPAEKIADKPQQEAHIPTVEVELKVPFEAPQVIQQETIVTEEIVQIPTEKVQTETIASPKPIEKTTTKINTSTETKIEGLSKSKDDSFASSLANKKITDIKQAISIADRFRFQRELFENNGEKMNTALSKLNTCTSSNEAETYLKSFAWNSESETVADFMNLVNRLFL